MKRLAVLSVLLIAIVGCSSKKKSSDAQISPPVAQEKKIVLFDGTDTSAWQHQDGSPCKWEVADGAMQVKGGDIFTREKFGDCTVHVEFWIPQMPENVKGQARSNSGVYLMGRYEVQVLDSYGLESGKQDCGAIYLQKAPDVNACLPPEQWQAYDIEFIAPVFDADGKKIKKPKITVTQNGKVIHKDIEIDGPTKAGDHNETPGDGPLRLQDHGNPIKYRNIWIIPKKSAQAEVKTAAKEAPQKEVVLFDGKDTNGWKQAGPGKFDLADGVLTGDGGMGLFWNEKEFENFTLKLEFKVGRKEDNSGVFVRFPDPGNDPWVAVKQGYEIQICDTEKGKQTGAVYNFKDSSEIATKPVGEWNDYEITVVGQKYTVKVNGKVVNEYVGDGSRPLKGRIGIQNHDPKSKVSFRNIRLIELPPSPPGTAEEKKERVIAPEPKEFKNLSPGVVGQYFKDIKDFKAVATAQKPFLVRVDKNVHFKRTEGNFAKTKLALNFGARWEGVLHVEEPGEYTFYLESDDGSQLFIDHELMLDNFSGLEVSKEKASKPIKLAKGDYLFRVDYQQGPGGAGCMLSWSHGDNKTKAAVPETALFHRKKDEQIAWDEAAYKKYTFDKKSWRKEAGAKTDKMDFGQFLSATIDVGTDNTALKGIAIKLNKESDKDEKTICFDTELLRYSGGWTGGFLNLTGVAYDGSHGPFPTADGDIAFTTKVEPCAREGEASLGEFKDPRAKPFGTLPREWGHYKGLYLSGDRVVLSYSVGKTDVLDLPGVVKAGEDYVFTRTFQLSASDKPLTIIAAIESKENPIGLTWSKGATTKTEDGRIFVTFPARKETTTYKIAIRPEKPAAIAAAVKSVAEKRDVNSFTKGGEARWTKPIETKGVLGAGDGPYVVDTLTEPENNPYDSWLRFGGLDFFSNGDAALCTWNGDVWVVSGIDDKLEHLKWKRFATGLHQSLGLRIVDDKIYALGRDQITRLHDLNKDGEADFYENFNNDCQVSTSFHEFAFDLQTDPQGNFYYAKAGPVRPGGRGWQIITDHNGCVLTVSKDGSKFEVFATGVRAPNGMGVGPDGQVSVADNEGTWTPACRLSFVTKGQFIGVPDLAHATTAPTKYLPPICWLPHGNVDNSSGAQVWVTSDNWGPFKGEMLHLSYGKCALFHVLKEKVDGQIQGGVVKFPVKFDTGICRARFGPKDGQLYLAGLRGWQTDATKDAALHRMRFTGKPVDMPNALHVTDQGISLGFTTPVDPKVAADLQNYSVEQWNYLWSKEYGSPEYSVENPTQEGHDTLDVEKATVSPDGKSVFLTVADLKPVMQMKIQMKLKSADGKPMDYEIYNTINKVASTRTANSKPKAATQATVGQN